MEFNTEKLVEEIAGFDEDAAPIEPLVQVRRLKPDEVQTLLRKGHGTKYSVAMTYPKRRMECRFIVYINAPDAATHAKAIRALKFKKFISGCFRKTVKTNVSVVGKGVVGPYEICVSPTEKCYAQILKYNKEHMDVKGYFALACPVFVSEETVSKASRADVKKLQRAPSRARKSSKSGCVIS